MTQLPDGLYREPPRPTNCPVCGGLEFSGPSFEPGLGCACHPDSVTWECTTCHFVVRAPIPPTSARAGTVP